MVILRFRTGSEAKDLLKKLKKMHKFTKELMECVEEKYDEDDDYDDDADYREDDDYESSKMRKGMYRRYRRSM